MHPRLVERVSLPLLHRRTWPLVRRGLRELRESERTPADELKRRSLDLALRTAKHAAAKSPFLRALYRDARLDAASIATAEEFRLLPVMTKQMLRDHCEHIVAEDADRADIARSATGGSTGVPTPYYHDTNWWCRATAAALRGDEWTGWKLGERHATVWGTPLGESRGAAAIRRFSERARNFLFLPGFDLAKGRADVHLERLAAFKPVLLSGYASILAGLAQRALERGGFPAPPLAIISSAEPMPADVRDLVERAFSARVFDRYGSREIGLMAQECRDHAGMHVVSEHVYLEIDVDGRPARPGETGRLLVTLLDNPSFPLVRYEVGDLATAGEDRPCACGLPNQRLARVEGRQLDVIWSASGGPLTGVFFPHLMKEHRWVGAFQVVQDAQGDVEIRVIVDPSVPCGDGPSVLVRVVREALGGLPVRLSFVKDLERTPSGKVRVTRSDFRTSQPAPAETAR
jgi:phenylacetate-CoA ligase